MRVRRGAGVMAVVALAIGLTSPPVGAGGTQGYGMHTPHTGLHWILDTTGPDPELPPVTCVYGGDNQRLRMFKIRQPVMLANRPEGYRSQVVGWKERIEGSDSPAGPWTPVTSTGAFTKATATAPYPVDLAPKQLAMGSGPLDWDLYRVTYLLRWYRANGQVDGEAAHWAIWYTVSGSFGTYKANYGCPFSSAPLSAGRPESNGELEHEGTRGPHWVLDAPGPGPEFPAVICHYDASDVLDRVEVRRPMMLARDRGPGIQAQDVRWRALIHQTASNSGSEFWMPLARSGWNRARATERSWAKLSPALVELGPEDSVYGVRVVYLLQWFRGTSSDVIGQARHAPIYYLRKAHDGSLSYQYDYCGWELPHAS